MKSIKKRDARALFFLNVKPTAFLTFYLPSPSLLLKLPNTVAMRWRLFPLSVSIFGCSCTANVNSYFLSVKEVVVKPS